MEGLLALDGSDPSDKADQLGAPLVEGERLYTELQHTYRETN